MHQKKIKFILDFGRLLDLDLWIWNRLRRISEDFWIWTFRFGVGCVGFLDFGKLLETLGFEPRTFGFGIGYVTTRLTCLPLVPDKIP